jgi:hypothetical protein
VFFSLNVFDATTPLYYELFFLKQEQSHLARKKNVEAMQKKESLVTKMLREVNNTQEKTNNKHPHTHARTHARAPPPPLNAYNELGILEFLIQFSFFFFII